MRVLALIPGEIGDQILFFPTLDSLKRSYPTSVIDVVVEPQAKPAYRISTIVHDVILFDFSANNSPSDWANLLGIMRDREYDVILNASSSWSIGLMLWLSGIPTRIGYADSPGALFLTQAVARKSAQYQAYAYHDLLQGLGLSLPCTETAINVPQGDLDWANQQREQLGLKGSGYVLIYDDVTATGGYPVAQWQAIVQDFQKRQPDLPLVLLQDRGNFELTQPLTQLEPGIKVCNVSNVGQMAAMVAGADLLLCTANAAMHIAIALNVFTLALFNTQSAVESRLPPSGERASENRFVGIASTTSQLADIAADRVLQKVWGG